MMTNNTGKYVSVLLLLISISLSSVAQVGRMRMQPRREPVREQIIERQENKAFQKQNNNQVPNQRRPNVQLIKEEFIQKRLSLTQEQSEKFGPLYHQYQMELFNVRRLKKINRSDVQTNSADQINKDIIYDGQIVEIRKKYMAEFFKIMPQEKVSLLLKAEGDFNQELMKEVAEKNSAANGAAPPNSTTPPK
ncbi:MAG: hypothetical protein ACXVAY_08535 [Mucilaginibacter sp.]